ncbi:hypothetical protein Tco_1183336 [Tanacetum coccineum]
MNLIILKLRIVPPPDKHLITLCGSLGKLDELGGILKNKDSVGKLRGLSSKKRESDFEIHSLPVARLGAIHLQMRIYAGCQDTRRSTSGSITTFGVMTCGWSSKRHEKTRKALRYPVRKLNILLCLVVVLKSFG